MEFLNLIVDNDIVFLFESRTNRDSTVEISGYVSHNFYRKFQNRYAKRCSGGLVIYLKEHLKDGIEIYRNHFDTLIWLKLKRDGERILPHIM